MAKTTGSIDPVFAAANAAYLALKDLPAKDLQLAMNILSERFNTSQQAPGGGAGLAAPTGGISAARRPTGRAPTPKDFMAQKRPQKRIDRIACLAYYLTHSRDTPSFKTGDLTALNTEARQPKFTSASVHVDNATKADYLTSSGRGFKSITTRGEALVDALPDAEKVKQALEQSARVTKRRKKRKPPK